MLTFGDRAPEFSLPDQDGKLHSLADYRGKWVVLYFYPEDDTPGCIKEACGIRDNYVQFLKRAVVLGVSGDTVKSHKKFADKYSLPFTLLSDRGRSMIDQYGANGVIWPKRITFVIDPSGTIAKIYEKVTPTMHADELLFDLDQLQQGSR